MRDSEARTSLAVESAQLALWDWDVTNDSVWMTDEARKFLGFEPGELIHFSTLASLDGRVHPDDRVARATAIQRALETRGSYEAEYRMLSPDGSVRWISSRGYPSQTAGDALPRILGVSMDITRQKQADAEAQLQREELAHLSRVTTLSALSGSLAHELCQPLSSILLKCTSTTVMSPGCAPTRSSWPRGSPDIVTRNAAPPRSSRACAPCCAAARSRSSQCSVNDSIEELLRPHPSDLIARGVSVSNLTTGETFHRP